MTAPEPTAEHIDAVAHLLAVSNGTVWDYVPGGADDADPYIRDARAILTTPRADIHAAILAALVRAGVLTRHVRGPTFGGGYQSHFQTTPEPATQDDALAHLRERMSREVAP